MSGPRRGADQGRPVGPGPLGRLSQRVGWLDGGRLRWDRRDRDTHSAETKEKWIAMATTAASITETAKAFFEACETGKGWEGCSAYCRPNATFAAQLEPLAETRTL